MISGLSSSLSGLIASSKRLDVSASNTANLRSTGALPGNSGQQAYQPRQPIQSSLASGGAVTGSRPITPAYIPEYAPDASFADADGMVAAPNVDLVRETAGQISAKQAYGFSLKALQANDDMMKSLLDLKT